MSPLDTPEVSGIAGTAVTTDYSYDVVRFLAARHPRAVEIDWDGYEGGDRLRALWPKFLPLLEEEALEDANVPYRDWLRAGRPRRGRDLEWLLGRLDRLDLPPDEKAERFDALGFPIRWRLSRYRATRTGQRWPGPKVFSHDSPLLSRRDVSIPAVLGAPRLSIERLPPSRGRAAVAMTRTATALRYREYYGFTYAEPAIVRRTRIGRGVEILLFGLERDRRLPLRAGFAAFLVKNSVPIGYVEALCFFERVEIGFNIYYTFREGESAWLFAHVLKLLAEVLGSRSFSIDPYQIGHENREAIASGAFWFYRKLGFRPTDPEVARLVAREEELLARDPEHRSRAGTLKRIATSSLIYSIEDPHSAPGIRSSPRETVFENSLPRRGSRMVDAGRSVIAPRRFSDRFHIRNLGLAVNRRMVRDHGSDAETARRKASARVARALDVRVERWHTLERRAFENLALVFDLIPNLEGWAPEERRGLVRIARAKAAREELEYLRLSQRHARLRRALIELGSRD